MQSLVPRMLPHMSSAEEALLIFYVIATNLSSLPGDVVSVGRHTGAEMETFLKMVIGPFVPILSTPACTARWLIMLLQQMMAKGDIVYVSCCKVGCILLTIIIHQAELRMAEEDENTRQDWYRLIFTLFTHVCA